MEKITEDKTTNKTLGFGTYQTKERTYVGGFMCKETNEIVDVSYCKSFGTAVGIKGCKLLVGCSCYNDYVEKEKSI